MNSGRAKKLKNVARAIAKRLTGTEERRARATAIGYVKLKRIWKSMTRPERKRATVETFLERIAQS